MSTAFNLYIRSLSCSLLHKTVHDSVLEERPVKFGCMTLWQALKDEMGDEAAKAEVAKWLTKPWTLKPSETDDEYRERKKRNESGF